VSQFEDEEHTEFFRVEKPGAEDLVISRAAMTLSAAGLSNSVAEGTPGFISDEYLSAIAAETTLTAIELVTAGEWRRVEDGYRVTDPKMQEFADSLWRRQREFSDWTLSPEDCSTHSEGPNSRGRCVRCGTPVETD
jgi:hypothetical protein